MNRFIYMLQQMPLHNYIKCHVFTQPGAIAITLIVIGHFSNFHISTTSLLFVISGYSFGKFQLSNILKNENVKNVIKLATKIAIPTVLLTIAKQASGFDFILVNLLLIGNFYPITINLTRNFWFIDCLLQCFIILSIIFSIKFNRDLFSKNAFKWSIIFTFINLFIIYILRKFNIHSDYVHGNYPTDYLWLMLLGITIASAQDIMSSFKTVLLVCVSICAAFYCNKLINSESIFELSDILFLIPVYLLIFIKKIPMLTLLTKPITFVASASLFIYLTHYAIGMRIQHLFSNGQMPLFFITLIIFGIASKLFYDKLEMFVKKRLRIPSRRNLN